MWFNNDAVYCQVKLQNIMNEFCYCQRSLVITQLLLQYPQRYIIRLQVTLASQEGVWFLPPFFAGVLETGIGEVGSVTLFLAHSRQWIQSFLFYANHNVIKSTKLL